MFVLSHNNAENLKVYDIMQYSQIKIYNLLHFMC